MRRTRRWARRRGVDSLETAACRWSSGVAQHGGVRRGGGPSVAGNDMTESCTVGRERKVRHRPP
jgi:hypothetical protein